MSWARRRKTRQEKPSRAKRRAERWILPAAVGLLASAMALVFFRQEPKPVAPPPESPAPAPSRSAPAPAPTRPVKAFSIIIDDLGHKETTARPFLEMEHPLALAFLPHRPYTADLAQRAHRSGKTVLLHLPMEPYSYPETDPGEGAVMRRMDEAEIDEVIDGDLATVPFASGINNHMGSLATEDPRVMADVMGYAKKKGLFFVDSLTSPRSVAEQQARQRGVPALSRDIFLDNETSPEAIDRMMDELLDLADSRGYAVGIGHPHPETALALERLSSRAHQRGIQWLPVQDLIANVDAWHRDIVR